MDFLPHHLCMYVLSFFLISLPLTMLLSHFVAPFIPLSLTNIFLRLLQPEDCAKWFYSVLMGSTLFQK